MQFSSRASNGSPVADLLSRLRAQRSTPVEVARRALSRSNQSASHNTYLWQDKEWTLNQAARLNQKSAEDLPLYGLPISVKDCFDLANVPTSCGSRFYAAQTPPKQDSWVIRRLQELGAVLTGKTHLHPLAYGITGENAEYGNCIQPNDAASLTGGSSSGAAASIQEGSAIAAIGTDTGGSIRVPAALCGLAGYRSSHGMGDWQGGAHLAESFDTIGLLFASLVDGPLLGSALFGLDTAAAIERPRIAIVEDAFLDDAEPEIRSAYTQSKAEWRELGATLQPIDVDWWRDSREIFTGIQAHEASGYHQGHYREFSAEIAERLERGASMSEAEVISLRVRHRIFRDRMDALFSEADFLLLPAAPVARLPADADHSQTRTRVLRYTTPVSLSGMPAMTLPMQSGGMQLVAKRGDDAVLLATAARLGAARHTRGEFTNSECLSW